MSASNAFETSILDHILNNANIANIGDATGLRGSSTAGSLYVGLHTSDPGEAGNQSTNEASFTGYARKAIARSGAAWSVSGNSGSNAGAVTFDPCTAGSATVTHFSIGTDSSGSGNLLFSGALSASLAISAGITPNFAAGQLAVTAD